MSMLVGYASVLKKRKLPLQGLELNNLSDVTSSVLCLSGTGHGQTSCSLNYLFTHLALISLGCAGRISCTWLALA